ncbi:MAG TPA: preprotein translocase subunit SecY [Candidatus Sumerlaeota bacterium]|nr:preprotein translocase subunit SecY [Candidatus Sumerlaeota bacterium]HPK02559.1 preprotein translocase subunit SecY [Candidatus Sumerlaeota bacterium]
MILGSLINIFRVPDLRRKVLITLGLILVYRIGAHVPTPFIDPVKIREFFRGTFGSGGVFNVVDMFSGGAFSQMTVFALGIMPYISASIILQLLTAVWPRLEKISKEGEAGRKKITQWTRYGTVGLSLFQGFGIGIYLLNEQLSLIPDHPALFLFVTAMTMCTGTCFIMWLGEKISQHGIGNGISIIITIGIIARYPIDLNLALMSIRNNSMTPIGLMMVLALGVLVAALIVFGQQANRKVPVQHARRMVGRKMVQGGNTFIPLKLNTAGVIPVIFSSAILTFPAMILPMFGGGAPGSIGFTISSWLEMNSIHNPYNAFNLTSGGIFSLLKMVNIYTLAYIALTAFFCFFYTAITLNPVDLADNLKKSGAYIPGIKPGKHTADYIDHILVRITVVGAFFLIVVALVPDMLYVSFNIPFGVAQMAGGTGLIIVVGVVLDTMMQIESQLMMRHYEGFGRSGGRVGSRSRRPVVRMRGA